MALYFDIRSDPAAGVDDPRPIAIRTDQVTLTRLLRAEEHEPDDYFKAPPAQLAFWLTDNWWRLRYECLASEAMPPEWRLAHELSSIGGGYAWPRIAVWGEGERVGIASRSDPQGVMGPVRFLTDALLFIAAVEYERAVDQFLQTAADERVGYGSDRAALRTLLEALTLERADPEIADWRRIEAELGFDPSTAPESLMQEIAQLIQRYGRQGIEEAAIAAPGAGAAEVLRREISAAEASPWTCDFSDAVKAAGKLGNDLSNDPPWTAAEKAAQTVRQALGTKPGPLRNKHLSELVGVGEEAFRPVPAVSNGNLAYGLRLKSKNRQTDLVALRSRWTHDRRFEVTRALGDKIWSKTDPLGPLARSKTARQKFQRAFAQSLLCPFEDLMNYVNTQEPNEEDVSAAARHFHVAERVIQTILVNKHVIRREDFDAMVEAA